MEQSGKNNDLNLIIINIDALRADHLGCYGYKRNTSSFIDSRAMEGVLFENALSNSSFTRESVAVLLSGKLPTSGGCYGWFASPSPVIKNMGELFYESGYKTGFFTNSNMMKDPNFSRGFEAVYHHEDWGVSRKGLKLSYRAIKFMRECKNSGKKFMIYLHYLDPHGPYDPPDMFYRRFARNKFPNPLNLYRTVRKKCSSLIKEGFGPGDIRFEDLMVRYDAEISFIDNSIKILFRGMEALGFNTNTIVIITADHGEEFLEHQFVEHGWTLYNESLHVPLIFWAPKILKPARINQMVSTVDIFPSILKLMKIPNKRKIFDGSPVFQSNGNHFIFNSPKTPIIAELLIQHRNLIRMVIKDNWKYITYYKWLEPRERPKVLANILKFETNKKRHRDIWGPVIREELYRLDRDPDEKNPVSNKKKSLELKWLLEQYKIHCKKNGLPVSVKKKPALSQEDMEKLKTLGYL